MKKHLPKSVLLLVAVISACAATAYAGPPFLTDDPEPVEYHHGEFYVFSILDATNGSTTIQVPAFELNYGIAEETQAHIIAPLTAYASDGNPTQYGLGDLQLGVKYRFLKETEDWPQLGIYPMLMVPTGNVVRGLGNGSAWAELPLWAQKSWGKWTTYGGIGLAINPGAGHNNFMFGGWLLQRKVTEKLTLGGEIFCQGPNDAGMPASPPGTLHSSVLVNLGGIYDIDEHFHFLASGGCTIAGDLNTPGYLAIQYTW